MSELLLLQSLKDKGVWLQDASPIGLYRNGNRVEIDIYDKVLRCFWNKYLKDLIKSEKPKTILVIGKKVYGTLEKQMKELGNDIEIMCINQPQGDRTKEQMKSSNLVINDLYKKYFSK